MKRQMTSITLNDLINPRETKAMIPKAAKPTKESSLPNHDPKVTEKALETAHASHEVSTWSTSDLQLG